MDDTIIQWYPGHIAKLERELQPLLKQLDVVIEVLDARIPQASWNQQLSQKIRHQKPVLLVLNKADLADPHWTSQWEAHYREIYPSVLSFSCSTGKGKQSIIQALQHLGEPEQVKRVAKGLKRRPVRTGIVGMPNVGKSSILNTLVGVKKAHTGHRAGVTRTTQWVRVHPQVELLDTPGLIPPKLESAEMGKLLASVYSVGDAAFEEEMILPDFMERINTLYPGMLTRALDLPADTEATPEAVARRRGYLLPGDELDYRRTAQAVFKDFRHGRLGRITLEHPHQGPSKEASL